MFFTKPCIGVERRVFVSNTPVAPHFPSVRPRTGCLCRAQTGLRFSRPSAQPLFSPVPGRDPCPDTSLSLVGKCGTAAGENSFGDSDPVVLEPQSHRFTTQLS